MGGTIAGFPERRWKTVTQFQEGDLIFCYLIGLSRFVGILEVSGAPFMGYKPIWTGRVYPARVAVRVLLELSPEYGVPVLGLADELSYFQSMKDSRSWSAHFRSAPISETPQDAAVILNALELASEDPVFRTFDQGRLTPQVQVYETQNGVYTIPEDTRPMVDLPPDDIDTETETPVTHDEIQWILLNLGSQMGLDVWVARNDRGRAFNDQEFANIPNLCDELPRQFDPATNRTIELIDVLWLKDGAILAAFEIEHTSAVYSGLLRMADLLAMQPNLNIRLYIVAPDDRREKVLSEINRPAFSRLKPPLSRLCQYIPYSALKGKLAGVQEFLPHLQPSFLNEIAESVEVDV